MNSIYILRGRDKHKHTYKMKVSDTYKICNCGRKIYPRYNSTIISEKCPTCQLKDATKRQKTIKSFPVDKFKTSAKKKRSARQKAMDNADMWFSRYIRLKHSEIHGTVGYSESYCRCFTCGNYYSVKNIDCGHYIGRGEKHFRFNEDNARPQCKKCNRFKQGEHKMFHSNLIKEIGSERVDQLLQIQLYPGEDNEIFYREQAKIYREKFNQLVKEKGIINPWKD